MIISPERAKCKQPFLLLLRLGSANIIQSNAIKILGVSLTDNFSWDTQVKHVQSVVNSTIGVLRRFSSSLNTDARLKIFNAFILPRITYCLPVWGNGSATATSKLDRCLLQSVRILLQKETHLQYLCSGLLKDSSSQSTRSSEGCKFYALRYIRKCDEQCFQYKAVLFDWNSLPPLLTSQTNFNQFICTLNKYITSKLNYTTNTAS